MSQTYTYFISTDFGGIVPNIEQLMSEIQNNPGITETLINVVRYGDDILVAFQNTLSPAEKTILDLVVANHVPVYDIFLPHNVQHSSPMTVTVNNYKRIASLTLLPTTIAKAFSISFMDPDATSYDIRFINRDNQSVLLTKNLTNTTEELMELGTLSGVSSTDNTQIDVSVKRNGGSSKTQIYIQNITIRFL